MEEAPVPEVGIVNQTLLSVQSEQSKLVHALKEKDVLIKEIHHRIKNNLQMISSILYLKLISFESGEVRNFLEDMRDKIKSIALIHERLLHTEKLDSIDIRDLHCKIVLRFSKVSGLFTYPLIGYCSERSRSRVLDDEVSITMSTDERCSSGNF